MEFLLDAIGSLSQTARAEVEAFLAIALRPWVGYQLAILAGIAATAWLLARWFRPRLHDWLRAREGWPLWRMRTGLVLHRRLYLILFTLLTWLTVAVMRETTWPSRSYLLTVFGNLALAWLVVALATRLIANPVLRSILRYGAWTWVTLRLLDLTDATVELLDRAAIDLGELRLSLWLILQAVTIIGLFLFAAAFLTRSVSGRIENNAALSPSMQVLTVKLMQMVLYGGAFVLGLRAIGVDLTGFAVLSGAIGIGLGFGLQTVVSNLVSGVIILLDKSIKPGDVISLGETFGWIQQLGARYVSVVTRDGKEYLIPNEDLITGQVVNWSHTNSLVRLDIHFGTSYADDPHLVRKVAVEAAGSVDRVLATTKPVCHITGFGDSSVDYILRFWIADPTGGLTNVRGAVFLALWDAFRREGISIPFPQREVRLLPEGVSPPDPPPPVAGTG